MANVNPKPKKIRQRRWTMIGVERKKTWKKNIPKPFTTSNNVSWKYTTKTIDRKTEVSLVIFRITGEIFPHFQIFGWRPFNRPGERCTALGPVISSTSSSCSIEQQLGNTWLGKEKKRTSRHQRRTAHARQADSGAGAGLHASRVRFAVGVSSRCLLISAKKVTTRWHTVEHNRTR